MARAKRSCHAMGLLLQEHDLPLVATQAGQVAIVAEVEKFLRSAGTFPGKQIHLGRRAEPLK
jgi:hypothetical protein